MGLGSVIVCFAMCFYFNVFLNSFDVYSDIALAFNTLTFNLGDSLLLSGCKVCHGKEDKDVFSLKNDRSCKQCVTQNYYFACGGSYQILEKMNEIENKNETCDKERFGVRSNKSSILSYEWRNETCKNEEDECCINVGQENHYLNPLNFLNKKIIAYQPNYLMKLREDLALDIFLLSSKQSLYHCERIFLDYVDWIHSDIKPFIKENITNVRKEYEKEWFFKFIESVNSKIVLEKGFDANDECGLYVADQLKNTAQNSSEVCDTNACLVHLQKLKWTIKINSVSDWHDETYFTYGVKLGGEICVLLKSLGIASLVPIMINIVYSMLAFIDDLKFGNASKVELIFVLCACYPQLKCLKFLVNYLIHKDEKKLENDKKNYEETIGALEPFLEAAFQVHISFAITMAVEGFYPNNSAGYTISHFTSFKQALPFITFAISMVSSSIGMTKFLLQGPIAILPKDSLGNGLISLPFVCTLLINSMFAVRMICIEAAFFSTFRYQRYYTYKSGFDEATIDPIINPQYRLATFLLPGLLSFIFNSARLFATGNSLKHTIRKYPQIMLACCFTPFCFEGTKENTIRVWRSGTIFNAFFIGFLPQIVLLVMTYYRGIVNWDFIGLSLRTEEIYENNDALFKSRYGNYLFAIISGILFVILIILTFFTEKIFKHHGIYCKIFSILCFSCPNNCLNFDSEMSLSRPLQSNSTTPKSAGELEMEEPNSIDEALKTKKTLIQVHIYPRRKKEPLIRKQSSEQRFELKEKVTPLLVSHSYQEARNESKAEEQTGCKIRSCMKKLIFVVVSCVIIGIAISLAIIYGASTESSMKPYTCRPGFCSSFYEKLIHGTNDSVARACAIDPNCKAFRHSSQNEFGYLCNHLDRKKGYGDWKLCGFWPDIENCTCVGENNKWGEGAECNFYNGHESDFLNGKWCYAETTTCADATSAKYKRGLYLDNGRFGPSQKSCFKDKGPEFDFLGYGWCRSDRCNTRDETCLVDGYFKDGFNTDQCRAVCLQEPSCTGFATSSEAYPVPNRCFIHGHISSTQNFSDWNVLFDGNLTPIGTFSEWNTFLRSRQNVPTKSNAGSHPSLKHTACWRRKVPEVALSENSGRMIKHDRGKKTGKVFFVIGFIILVIGCITLFVLSHLC